MNRFRAQQKPGPGVGRLHQTSVWPTDPSQSGTPGHQAGCSCGWISDTHTTYPEAWLASAVHRRGARRNTDRSRDPRWLARRPI